MKLKRGRESSSRFPVSIFITILVTLLIAAGANVGLMMLMERLEAAAIVQTHVMLLYWLLVASGLTLFVRARVKKLYEEPLMRVSEATREVAKGDFSVYIPTAHTEDRYDYLDRMILDLNKMIEALGSIETLKTEFFSNVSHEIKTPLAVMHSASELLLKAPLANEQREQAELIHRQSRRLAELIGNILKLNKLEKQVIVPEPAAYDLCGQLAECALLFEEAWSEKDIEFEAELEDSCVIVADRGLTDMLWTNLISNAVKFTGPGGRITLSQHSERGRCMVSVADTGCGMDETTRARVFEKFYQGDTSHAAEGNGLGMALAQRVCRLHGYDIDVDSAPGKGSVFTVTIPLDKGGEARE